MACCLKGRRDRRDYHLRANVMLIPFSIFERHAKRNQMKKMLTDHIELAVLISKQNPKPQRSA